MNSPSSRFQCRTYDALCIIRDILGHERSILPQSTNVSASEILEYLERTELRLLFRYAYKNKLYKRNVYYVYGNKTRSIMFDTDAMTKHFNIAIQPQYRQTSKPYYQYISNRLINEIVKFLDESALLTHHKKLIKSYILKCDAEEFTTGQDRHFDLTSTGRLTYTPANKTTQLSENDKWLTTCRQEIKYGRGFRKIIQPLSSFFSDQLFEEFHNHLHKKYHFADKFIIVSGDDIKTHYLGDNYANNTGSLRGSCMKYIECQGYLDIYAENPDTCRMLVSVNDDGQTTGRALLWTSTRNNETITLMDRIYGNDITQAAFKDYAHNHNFLPKQHQNYHNAGFVLPNGSIESCFRVHLQTIPDSYEFPYMDTFKYLNTTNQVLSTFEADADLKLEDTHGGYQDMSEDWVTLNTGERVHQDDAGWCEHEEEWYHIEECRYSHIEQTYVPVDHSYYVPSEDDYVHEDNDNYALPADSDDYYHTNELIYSEYDGCYYYEDFFECPIYGYVGNHHLVNVQLPNGDEEPVCRDCSALALKDHYSTHYDAEQLQEIIELNPLLF